LSADEGILLCGLLVHWHDEEGAARVVAAWGDDPRFQLLVIDNGSTQDLPIDSGRVLCANGNLGFAGAVNLGLRQTDAPLILMLNTDCRPQPGALERIVEGFAQHPDAAGLVPQLLGPDGRSQHRWQLRPLPSPVQLVLQALMLPMWSGPKEAPSAGSPVEQPAAAALAIRRQVLLDIGGLDERFFPAWFEDVDLAARLKANGKILLYWPDSRFVHDLGGSVATLGYSRFLWLHYRNLCRYLRQHHGPIWAETARLVLLPACLIRTILLPLRKPKRAGSRREAALGLMDLARGAASKWRLPVTYQDDPRPQESGSGAGP